MREREKRTEETRQYLERLPDLTVVSIRECQWYHQKWADKQKDMETFLNHHFPGRSERKQTQTQFFPIIFDMRFVIEKIYSVLRKTLS